MSTDESSRNVKGVLDDVWQESTCLDARGFHDARIYACGIG